jgi:hypothetical protein
MHDLDKLNRERRGAETAKLDAARALLAALIAVETTLNNAAPITAGTRYNMGAAIAQAAAAGIKAED